MGCGSRDRRNATEAWLVADSRFDWQGQRQEWFSSWKSCHKIIQSDQG